MKKALSALLALLLVSLAACGAPTPTTTITTPTQTETEITDVVTFADPTLEEIVRGAIGKPSGDITLTDAKAVTSLNLALWSGRNTYREENLSAVSPDWRTLLIWKSLTYPAIR